MLNEINIAFTAHRVEFLPSMIDFMKKNDIIILEEAPNSNFQRMLKGEMSIDSYIEEELFDFPQFSYHFYENLQALYKKGKIIIQIEPYIERLIKIYNIFSEGKEPKDIEKYPELREVYEAEKKATKELINFYEASISKSFDEIIESVKRFAKADADRFRLRDYLRAEEIINKLPKEGKILIEAGAIHQYLRKIISLRLNKLYRVKGIFLLQNKIRKLTGKIWLFPPGDILTLRYIFNKKENKEWENLLSARSLIYILLIEKDEMLPSKTNKFPHLMDEIEVIKFIGKLSFDDCKNLYFQLRFLNKEKRKKFIARYLQTKQQQSIILPHQSEGKN